MPSVLSTILSLGWQLASPRPDGANSRSHHSLSSRTPRSPPNLLHDSHSVRSSIQESREWAVRVSLALALKIPSIYLRSSISSKYLLLISLPARLSQQARAIHSAALQCCCLPPRPKLLPILPKLRSLLTAGPDFTGLWLQSGLELEVAAFEK